MLIISLFIVWLFGKCEISFFLGFSSQFQRFHFWVEVSLSGNGSQSIWKLLLGAVCLCIWKERIGRSFEGQFNSQENIFMFVLNSLFK